MEQVDFVISWVDGNDPVWQAKKAMYTASKKADVGLNRYRDWDILKYWFRGVEKFAPWVRKIHFITDDQHPAWLKTKHPKLHLVHHQDYIPKAALPVFNSSALEINIHTIDDLAERFVYFNDDMFLLSPVKMDYYFRQGLPVDMPGLLCKRKITTMFGCMQQNNVDIINKYFSKRAVLLRNWSAWFKPQYGLRVFVRTCLGTLGHDFYGFVMPHLSVPYRKQTWEECWAKEGVLLEKTCFHRFRCQEDNTSFLMRYWRLCTGEFIPRQSLGKYIALRNTQDLTQVVQVIREQRYPEICLNDCWEEGDFEKAKERLVSAFDALLPAPCSFER